MDRTIDDVLWSCHQWTDSVNIDQWMNLSWNIRKRHRPLSHGHKICAPYELTVIRTWYGRVHGHEWCEAWWWNQSVSWFVQPVKSTPHGAWSWFYAQLLNSVLRASSLFSSTRIFYILFYAHLLDSHSRQRVSLILVWQASNEVLGFKTPDNTPSTLRKRRSNSVWYNCHTAHRVSTD